MGEAESPVLVLQPQVRKLALVCGGPLLSSAQCELIREIPVLEHDGLRHSVRIPVERPLTIVVDARELVTLMTLGSAPEWLVAGYLRHQRLLHDVTSLESISVDWRFGKALVIRRPDERGVEFGAHPLGGAGCGAAQSLAGFMASATSFAIEGAPRTEISTNVLHSMLESLRQRNSVFRVAGAVHGCALFCGADLWISVEDASRRNAIDIVGGWMALHGVSGADKTLFTTGRLTAETVIKAAISGIPVLVSRKGVTGMAFDLAQRLGMTLLGRATDHSFVCYTGAFRAGTGIDVTGAPTP